MCCDNGIVGPVGPQGPQGVQGIQGVQGPQGRDCECGGKDGGCCPIFANVFATKPLAIGPYNTATDTVLFDSQNQVSGSSQLSTLLTPATAATTATAASAAVLAAGGSAVCATAASNAVLADVGKTYTQASIDAKAAVLAASCSLAQANAAAQAVRTSAPITSDFDLSLALSQGVIKFLKAGVYHMTWQLQGKITPPVPNPVPSWSFGFWINGVLVPGSIYSGFNQAPSDDACHSTGDVIIKANVGDLLKLRNTSVSPVSLDPAVNGSVFPITIASINIEALKC